MSREIEAEEYRIQFRKLISEVFNIPSAELIDAPTPENIIGWDSLGHWSLIEKIEEKFNIKIDHADVVELLSEEAIVNYLTGKDVDNSLN